jgi:hypothetical protein
VEPRSLVSKVPVQHFYDLTTSFCTTSLREVLNRALRQIPHFMFPVGNWTLKNQRSCNADTWCDHKQHISPASRLGCCTAHNRSTTLETSVLPVDKLRAKQSHHQLRIEGLCSAMTAMWRQLSGSLSVSLRMGDGMPSGGRPWACYSGSVVAVSNVWLIAGLRFLCFDLAILIAEPWTHQDLRVF